MGFKRLSLLKTNFSFPRNFFDSLHKDWTITQGSSNTSILELKTISLQYSAARVLKIIACIASRPGAKLCDIEGEQEVLGISFNKLVG